MYLRTVRVWCCSRGTLDFRTERTIFNMKFKEIFINRLLLLNQLSEKLYTVYCILSGKISHVESTNNV